MSDPDPLLSDLRAAGTFDSEGAFTIDAQAAAMKMMRYQLERPEMWVLPFVRAAAMAGATFFHVRAEWKLEWDGEPVEADDLRAMTLEERGQPRARALWTALLAARVLRPTRIEVSSGNCRAVLDEDRVTVTEAGRESRTRVTLHPAGRGNFFTFTPEIPMSVHDVGRVLRTWCALAPLRFKCVIDDSSSDTNDVLLDPGETLAAHVLEPFGGPRAARFRACTPMGASTSSVEGCRASLWIAGGPAPDTRVLVLDGISVPLHDVAAAIPAVSFIVAADGLQADASLVNVVRDERFGEIARIVETWARHLIVELAQHAADLRHAPRVFSILRAAAPHLAAGERPTVLLAMLPLCARIVRDSEKFPQDAVAAAIGALEQMAGSPDLRQGAAQAAAPLHAIVEHRVLTGRADTLVLQRLIDVMLQAGAPEKHILRRLALLLGVRAEPSAARLAQQRAMRGSSDDEDEFVAALIVRQQSPGLAEDAYRALVAKSSSATSKGRALGYLAETSLAQGRTDQARERYGEALEQGEMQPALCAALLEGQAEAWRADAAASSRLLERAMDVRRKHGLEDGFEMVDDALLWTHLQFHTHGTDDHRERLLDLIGRRWRERGHDVASLLGLESRYAKPAHQSPLQRAMKLLEDQPYVGIAFIEEFIADLEKRENVLSVPYRVALRCLARANRDIGKHSLADACVVKIHFLNCWTRMGSA